MNIDHYAVLGNPVAHSQSPFIHQCFARQTHQSMDYDRILAPLEDFAGSLRTFFAQGGQGCNITVPFKEQAYQLCTQLTQRAEAAKAVNTIKQTHFGLLGDNTDGAGLLADLQRHLDISNKHILLIGAGGAARGVLLPLLQAKPATLSLTNRTPERAIQLYTEFASRTTSLQYIPLTQIDTQPFDIIINATSAGLGVQALALPDALFRCAELAYDMVYGPAHTAFLQQAARCCVPHVVDGLGMLVHQAAEAFYVWRGVYPDTAPVEAALRAKLTERTP